MNIPSAWFDLPSKRDFTAEMVSPFFGGAESSPFKVIWQGLQIQNQWLKSITKMACGSFQIVHATNAMNIEEWLLLRISGERHWLQFVEEYAAKYLKDYGKDPLEYGSILQDQLAFGRASGYIDSYYKVRGVDQMESAIDRNQVISTGSNKISRKSTAKSPFYAVRTKNGSGHLFCIVGYNKINRYFIAVNSYGTEKYDNWLFYIPYDMIDVLYSTYALVDKKDVRNKNRFLLELQASKVQLQISEWKPTQADKEKYGVLLTYWLDRWDRHK